MTGYDVEILKEVGNVLSWKIEFTEMGVDGMLTAVNSGQVDIANYSLEDDNRMLKKFYVLNHTSIPSLQWSFVNRIILESLMEGSQGKKAAGAAVQST